MDRNKKALSDPKIKIETKLEPESSTEPKTKIEAKLELESSTEEDYVMTAAIKNNTFFRVGQRKNNNPEPELTREMVDEAEKKLRQAGIKYDDIFKEISKGSR